MSDLPDGWAFAPFTEAVQSLSTTGHVVEAGEYVDDGSIPVLTQGAADLDGFTADFTRAFDSKFPLIVFGDHTRVVKLGQPPFAVGPNAKVLAPTPALMSKFLYYQLQTLLPPSRGYGRHYQFIAKSQLAVAPLEEQERIVIAIEQQFSRLAAGVDGVERVRQKLKRLRSAVLGAAVTGRLGEGARPETQDEGTVRLPEGWEFKQLRSLCQLENGDRSSNYPSKRYRVEAGIPFINAGHLNNGSVTTDSMDYISPERFDLLSAGKVRDGDLLFCLRGSLGKAALVEGIGLGAIASSLVILRPNAAMSGPYLLAYLLSPLAKEMIRKFDNGTAQPNLSAKDLGRFEVPVPDRAKQLQIVETLEVIQTAIAHLEASCDFVSTRYERIRSAILAAAFSGQLVFQDPSSEPASVLLERIATERDSANGHNTTSSHQRPTTRRRVPA